MKDIVKVLDESTKDSQPDIASQALSKCPMGDVADADRPLPGVVRKVVAGGAADITNMPSIRDESTSQHLAGTVELTVIANLKPGLINVRATMTYATRLRMLLRTLSAIRKRRAEVAEDSIFVGPIEQLQTIHNVSWTIFDNDRKMLMSVVFDRALEPYIRRLVDDGGSVLNTILCHCTEYDGDQGYAAFTNYVRRNQTPVELLGATVTGLTVGDQRYFKELEQQQRAESCPHARELAAATLRVKAPLTTPLELTEQMKLDSAKQALQVIALMYRLDDVFPKAPDFQPHTCTDTSTKELAATVADINRDRSFFLVLVKSMLPRFDTGWIPANSPLRERFSAELAWYEGIVCVACEATAPEIKSPNCESVVPSHEQIQGNILTEYKNMTHGCLLLLRLGAPQSARTFLQFLQSQVTTGAAVDSDTTLNVALTYNGLKTLGLSDAELLEFPKEFREGMQARASLLGDIGVNHPSNWKLPQANWPPNASADATGGSVPLATVDLVIQLQKANVDASDDQWGWSVQHPLYQEVANLAAEAERTDAQLLAVEPLRRKLINGNIHEHFGFRDGLSQPKPGDSGGNGVALGELLVGHENDHGDAVAVAEGAVLYNGTFLVVRKLAQDVAAFEQFLDGHGEDISREELAAKMVGRKVDGTPVVIETRASDATANNFDYEEDPDGLRCPFHAHIRRVNPRDEREKEKPVPRIMRRGFAYGSRYAEDPESDRGLMFMAYNANIAQQFEVIQRWISGGNSTGVLSTQSDPILGVAAPGHERAMSFVHERDKVLHFNLGEKPFVKLEWGTYLFVPSISALKKLSQQTVCSKPYPQANVARGKEILKKFATLDYIESRSDAVLRWKKLLEDRSSRRYAEDVWAAIRSKGGALRTPYGVLVADEALVMQLFRDEGEVVSVREFSSRMNQSTGLLYLGIDAKPRGVSGESQTLGQCPHHHVEDYASIMQPVGPNKVSRYQHESKSINLWIASFCPQRAFVAARQQTEVWLKKHLMGDNLHRGEIKLQELVGDVLGELAAQWFGLPNDRSVQIGGAPGAKPHCSDDFYMVSSYVFSPNPTPFVESKARERGPAMRDAIEKYVRTAIAENSLPTNTLLAQLHADGIDVDTIARTIGGVVVGFVSPTTGSLLSAINTWIMSEDFWRHQQAFLQQAQEEGDAYSLASGVLKSPLIRAMQERPVPPLPHRTAVQEVELGDVVVKSGERVVLSVASAALQQLEELVANEADVTRLLFGGNYGEPSGQATAHACPGQSMAFGTMLGIVSTLFELDGTLRSTGALTLSLNE